jgi:methanogenic corrinoid protein MtbC1
MQAALIAGDEDECQRLALGLYLDGNTAREICDDVLAGVFHDIGDRWAHGDLAVYEERRATEITLRILYQLRALLDPVREHAPLAIGATLAGDFYTLPTAMIEIALREAGWRAQSYGSNHPVETLCSALRHVKPALFWLSVSLIDSRDKFLSQYRELHLAARDVHAALIVGGRALDPDLLSQMRYSRHGDTLASIVKYADQLAEDTPEEPSEDQRSSA